MKKILFGVAALGLLGLAGAGLGLKAQDTVEAKADSLVYSCNYGAGEDWNAHYGNTVTDGGDARSFSFEAGKKFKFYHGDWAGELNFSNIQGTAKNLFTESSGSGIYVKVTGTYVVTISGSNLFLDLPGGTNFTYIGNHGDAEGDWTEGASVEVNGDPVEITFAKNEKFKFRYGGTWDANMYVALGGNNVFDWFGAFSDADGDDHNVLVNQAAVYKVSVLSENHVLTLKMVNRDTSTYYVLDLNGDLLNTIHKAHYWNGTVGSNPPGMDMSLVPGTVSLYSFTCWDVMTGLVINGDNDGQSIDLTLTGNEGKCLILSYSSSAYKWNSNTWAELETAKFIDGYMKFNVNNENIGGTTAACATNYAAAKAAYNANSFEDYRADFCSVAIAVARLQAWAEANGEEFTVTAGVGSFSGAKNVSHYETASSDDRTGAIAIIVAAVTILGAGAFFIARKRRAE